MWTITLPENPTTGYILIVDTTVINNMFTFTENYVSGSTVAVNGAAMTGVSGGIHTYTLTMTNSGTGTFRLADARPWMYNGNWSTYQGTKYSYTFIV